MNRESTRFTRNRSPRFDSLELRSLLSLWNPSALAVRPEVHPPEAKAVVAVEGLGRPVRRPQAIVGDRLAAPAGRIVAIRGTLGGSVSLTPLGGSEVQLALEGSGTASGLGRFTLSCSYPASLNPTTTPHQLTTIGREATLVAEDGTRLSLAIFSAGTIDDAGTAFDAEVGGTLVDGTRRFANASGVAVGRITADAEAGTFSMEFTMYLVGVRPTRR
jgi:hypothetical protein